MAELTREQCLKALAKVIDPELGLDAVSLGLIYGVDVHGQEVVVDMTMTSPSCPLTGQMIFEANNELLKIPGVERASVNLVWDPPWTPERMTEEAKMTLGFA